MARLPRKSYKKKPVKKMYRKPVRKSLAKMMASIALKKCETKHTHTILENVQLNHNSPSHFAGLLETTQGAADDDSGTSNRALRIGDEVVARGISLKMWFANKLDRPNVTYKVVIFRYQSGYAISSNDPYYSQGSANYLLRDLNTEQFKIVKVLNFRIQTAAQKINTVTNDFQGAEGHKLIKCYIPLKNYKQKYHNNSGVPKYTNMGVAVVAYDSYGTLTTDNIASYAVNYKFYFKDP